MVYAILCLVTYKFAILELFKIPSILENYLPWDSHTNNVIFDALCLSIKMASKAVAKPIVHVSAPYFGGVLSEDCSLIHVHLHVKKYSRTTESSLALFAWPKQHSRGEFTICSIVIRSMRCTWKTWRSQEDKTEPCERRKKKERQCLLQIRSCVTKGSAKTLIWAGGSWIQSSERQLLLTDKAKFRVKTLRWQKNYNKQTKKKTQHKGKNKNKILHATGGEDGKDPKSACSLIG